MLHAKISPFSNKIIMQSHVVDVISDRLSCWRRAPGDHYKSHFSASGLNWRHVSDGKKLRLVVGGGGSDGVKRVLDRQDRY